jgi:isoaspartyl peptidase/L-asparaginase-like protein (Ntn-hydrolase superfamily)
VFVRAAFAHELDAALRLGGLSLRAACEHALARVAGLGGAGGCIALAGSGVPIAVFNSPGMVRGWALSGSETVCALYADEG